TIGGETQHRSYFVMRPGGILVSIVQPPSPDEAAKHGVRCTFMRSDHNRGDQREKIANLVVAGQVQVHVETVMPLDEASKALELSERGHTRGKIALAVG